MAAATNRLPVSKDSAWLKTTYAIKGAAKLKICEGAPWQQQQPASSSPWIRRVRLADDKLCEAHVRDVHEAMLRDEHA